jgi:hypothetical protein
MGAVDYCARLRQQPVRSPRVVAVIWSRIDRSGIGGGSTTPTFKHYFVDIAPGNALAFLQYLGEHIDTLQAPRA